MTDAMWYIDGNHHGLKMHGRGVPVCFQQFCGYNTPEKRKKRKRNADSMKNEKIQELYEALFTVSACSYMKAKCWKSIFEGVLHLADSLRKYGQYQINQAENAKKNRAALFSQCSNDDDHRILLPTSNMKPTVQARYHSLHDALSKVGYYEPLSLNDICPIDRRRRKDYLDGLVVPVKCLLYNYTAASVHLHFIWKVNNDRVKKEMKSKCPVFHSRALSTNMVKPAVLRQMYRDLTGDSSAPVNLTEQQVDERLREALDLEDPDMIWDLRVKNAGRPEQFSAFLAECQKYNTSKVETAVDDRRHDQFDHTSCNIFECSSVA